MDMDPSGVPYGASIPISKALNSNFDVLLAYEMNDEEISLDHGYPLRVIVPGVIGARNVKWLNKINLSKNESPSQFQQNDYKGFSPSIDWNNVDFSKAPAIQEMPVTSAICIPHENSKISVNKNGTITVKGQTLYKYIIISNILKNFLSGLK
jgi:sulfite oxidase